MKGLILAVLQGVGGKRSLKLVSHALQILGRLLPQITDVGEIRKSRLGDISRLFLGFDERIGREGRSETGHRSRVKLADH